MHFPTYKALSMAVFMTFSSTMVAIPTVYGAPARLNVQRELIQKDTTVDSELSQIPPVPEYDWRTDGPRPIQIQQGQQNPLRFGQQPTTLPDVYKSTETNGYNSLAERDIGTTENISISDIWVEGLFDIAGLETDEIELLKHAINKRAEIGAAIVYAVNETKIDFLHNNPFDRFNHMNQDLNALFSDSLLGGADREEEQVACMREAAKTLKEVALRHLKFSEDLIDGEPSIDPVTGEKVNQDLTITLSNIAKDDNFVEILRVGMEKLVEEENRVSGDNVQTSEVFEELK